MLLDDSYLIRQKLVMEDNDTDIVLVSGINESRICLMKSLQHVQDPAARVLIVADNYYEIKAVGGLLDQAKELYSDTGATFNYKSLYWTFPNGAEVQFITLDVLRPGFPYQATHILVDGSFLGFTEFHLMFLITRFRSRRYKGKHTMLVAANFNEKHFLYDWTNYCRDNETGIPKEGTEGITRWFIKQDKLYWADSLDELESKFEGDAKKFIRTYAKSFKFIP